MVHLVSIAVSGQKHPKVLGEWYWRWIFWFTFLPVFSPIISQNSICIFRDFFKNTFFFRHDQLADSLVLAGESQLVPLPPGKLFTLKFSGKKVIFLEFYFLVLFLLFFNGQTILIQMIQSSQEKVCFFFFAFFVSFFITKQTLQISL